MLLQIRKGHPLSLLRINVINIVMPRCSDTRNSTPRISGLSLFHVYVGHIKIARIYEIHNMYLHACMCVCV